MSVNWSHRRTLERRMQRRGFRVASRALAATVVARTVAPLLAALASRQSNTADMTLACRVQGVAGHLMSIADVETLPADVFGTVRVEADRIAQRAERLSNDIGALGMAAAAAGLAFVPLKGTYLRSERYPSEALRPSSDIDLLIGSDTLPLWRRVLRELGYAIGHATHRHLVFVRPGEAPAGVDGEHPDHPRPVELHERIVDRVFGQELDVTDVYRADLRPGHLLGSVSALVPGDIALATHLCLHAAAAMLGRGMRLAQVLDFVHVDDGPVTGPRVQAAIGDAAWAVAHLVERDVPGLIPRLWIDDRHVVPPGWWRRHVILSRPGLLHGDPYRLSTLAGEALLSLSPGRVVERVRDAVRDRRSLRGQ